MQDRVARGIRRIGEPIIHSAHMICGPRFNGSGDPCEGCGLRSGRALCVVDKERCEARREASELSELASTGFNEKHSERYFF